MINENLVFCKSGFLDVRFYHNRGPITVRTSITDITLPRTTNTRTEQDQTTSPIIDNIG